MKRRELIESLPVKQITVLLAEDHANFRKSLKLLVESDGDIKVVGEAENGFEVLQMAGDLRPEVIIMDIAMPLLNGLDATRQLLETSPSTRVLILSAHLEPEYIKKAVICGASGYLIKQSSTQVLAKAVREVLKGNSFFCAPIAKPLRDQCQKLHDKAF